MNLCPCARNEELDPQRCFHAKSLGVDCRKEVTRTWRSQIKTHPYARIVKVHRPSMWYAGRVGETVKVTMADVDGLWARDTNGYLNVLFFEDVEWVPLPREAVEKRVTDLKASVDEILLDLEKLRKEAEELKKLVGGGKC